MKSARKPEVAQAERTDIADGVAVDPTLLAELAKLCRRMFSAPANVTGTSPLIPCDDCGLEKQTVSQLIASGQLPAVKLGRRWFCKRVDLEAMFDRLVEAAPKRAKPLRVAAGSPVDALASIAAAERKGTRR